MLPHSKSTGLNFTNILRAIFVERKSFAQLFSNYSFWQKNIGAKAAHKMLMKLTTGLNFTNILGASFSYMNVFVAFLYVQFVFVIFIV